MDSVVSDKSAEVDYEQEKTSQMVRLSHHTMVSMHLGFQKLKYGATVHEFRHYIFGGMVDTSSDKSGPP